MPDLFLTPDCHWLAGLLEGEGCFDCANKVTPRIRLTMTDLDIVIRAASLMGAHNVVEASRQTTKNKRVYVLTLHSLLSIEWMLRLYPLMGIRRQKKIEECISVWRQREQWTGRRKQKAKSGPKLSSLRTVWVNPDSVKGGL